ncbi:MAG: argininosuccinate lyase [Christensenellaceae bacterium]|nr:argininosuccinate lyase [Christensenellaceae bacterium]
MEKLWAGRTEGDTSVIADDFNSSIRFDARMYREDIEGSMAHAAMLGAKGIIEKSEADKIIDELGKILADIESGRIDIDMSSEDIHMFVESVLTKRIGETGKRLHTARSRNDQVALDFRMYLRNETEEIVLLVKELIRSLIWQVDANRDAIMPGYTHLQRAQPVTFAHQLLAYCMMLARDTGRLNDAKARMNFSPLGCCALAGTTYDTDRRMTADALGFSGVCENSIDGVSDRDFALEILSALSILMMHLSRLSEEIILWSSWEFRFVELSDAFTTGSSIMPQKKNSDMAELVRGKTGRVYGDLMALLTTLKGLPLAYNKDMQEDKEAVFDAVDTVKMCLKVFAPMIAEMKTNKPNMAAAAKKGFINATDLADYLVGKGMAFRDAYKLTGSLVRKCIEKGTDLESLTIEEYKDLSELFDRDVYKAIDLYECVKRRSSLGGASPDNIDEQIRFIENAIK